MKRFKSILIAALVFPMTMAAQGWPAQYGGVMLQGFYWDSFAQSQWSKLEAQAPDFKGYFDLVWVPQSGKCLNSTSMGYDPYYFFDQNSSFGTAQELKSMISTFDANGIKTIADVVVNHHNTVGWWTFPKEQYNGKTYQLHTTDIVIDDDKGNTRTQAEKEHVTLSINKDEGEGWDGMRDLDHKSDNVTNIIEAYQQFLVKDMGYAGFRYDMVKGFDGRHVGDYNTAAGVEFSVGEYWDGNDRIIRWINSTNKRSAAFDFQFRYNIRDAVNGAYDGRYTDKADWSKLNSDNNLIHDANYRRYAVTFVENHDMEQRKDAVQDPIRRDTLAANAFMLAMPGTPCVFYKHYLAYPNEIKAMIDVRKAAGITNQSDYYNYDSDASHYANYVKGNKASIIVMVGDKGFTPPTNAFVQVLKGYHYAYYMERNAEIPFADKASGTYSAPFEVTLSAVSKDSNAKLVYTSDGSVPTPTHGKQVASGTAISINEDCTLKVGLLTDGKVSEVITRDYRMAAPPEEHFQTPPTGYTYTAYFVAPKSWDRETSVYAWAWVTNGANYTPGPGAQWPGDKAHVYCIGKNKEGQYIWQWCYYGHETQAPQYIIFNNGSSGVGSNQTHDMVFQTTGWYDMNSTKSDITLDIATPPTHLHSSDAWYTLSGIRIDTPTQAGIYIHNGKKTMVR